MGIMKNIAASRGWKGFDIKLSSVDVANIEKKLEGMADEVKKKVISKALRSGGKIFIIEMKSRVRSDRVHQGIRGMKRTVSGIQGYIAGPSAGFPNPAWLEYGTLDKYAGRGRGKGSYLVNRTKSIWGADGNWYTIRAGARMTRGISPRPFVKPSWDSKHTAVFNKIGEVVDKELGKLATNGK
jgi:hypothetical protein